MIFHQWFTNSLCLSFLTGSMMKKSCGVFCENSPVNAWKVTVLPHSKHYKVLKCNY